MTISFLLFQCSLFSISSYTLSSSQVSISWGPTVSTTQGGHLTSSNIRRKGRSGYYPKLITYFCSAGSGRTHIMGSFILILLLLPLLPSSNHLSPSRWYPLVVIAHLTLSAEAIAAAAAAAAVPTVALDLIVAILLWGTYISSPTHKGIPSQCEGHCVFSSHGGEGSFFCDWRVVEEESLATRPEVSEETKHYWNCPY